MNYFYVIYENPSEFTSPVPRYIAETLQEAENHIMDYADWYCPQGTCQIRKVDKHMKVAQVYEYYNGRRTK